jgi:hypothetical protein
MLWLAAASVPGCDPALARSFAVAFNVREQDAGFDPEREDSR